MKKIPTLFERVYENNKIMGITDKITNGCENSFKKGIATVKIDGSCCAIIGGKFYKRYDAKQGKNPPPNAIPCQEKADEVTGHFPHWVLVDKNKPSDKWFVDAYNNSKRIFTLEDGTYEAIGKHFQGNPHKVKNDALVRHGKNIIEVARTFEDVRKYLENNYIEGIVFWLDGEPKCKIKRSDFGYEWNKKS